MGDDGFGPPQLLKGDGGFRILLDKRSIKTPAKAQVIAPTRTRRQIAQEWDAQGEMVDPMTMPYTRMTNSAIDKVTTQFDEVVEHSPHMLRRITVLSRGRARGFGRSSKGGVGSFARWALKSSRREHRKWGCLHRSTKREPFKFA